MAQLTPIKGFQNAKVTRSLVIVGTLLPLILAILDLKYLVILNFDYIYNYSQYWRVVLFQTSTINELTFLLVLILLFYFKVLERFYSSEKYFTIVLTLFIYNGLVLFIVITLFNILSPYQIHFLESGPLGLISSLFILYSHLIPTNYFFQLNLGTMITLSNHFPLQVIFSLLFFNNGIKSILPSSLGLIFGKLFLNDLLPYPKKLIPNLVFELFTDPFNASFTRSSIPVSENPIVLEIDNDEDDSEGQIRAETPVRPLAGQFIDTFRN